MASADSYDALVSPRAYSTGMPHEQALCLVAELVG